MAVKVTNFVTTAGNYKTALILFPAFRYIWIQPKNITLKPSFSNYDEKGRSINENRCYPE